MNRALSEPTPYTRQSQPDDRTAPSPLAFAPPCSVGIGWFDRDRITIQRPEGGSELMQYRATHGELRLQSASAARCASMVLLAFTFGVISACSNDPGTPTHDSASATPPSTPVEQAPAEPTPAPSPPSTPEPGPNTPITCQADSDCPHLSCGPCRSGQVVTELFIMVNCAVHPCPDVTAAVCRGGQCVVP